MMYSHNVESDQTQRTVKLETHEDENYVYSFTALCSVPLGFRNAGERSSYARSAHSLCYLYEERLPYS